MPVDIASTPASDVYTQLRLPRAINHGAANHTNEMISHFLGDRATCNVHGLACFFGIFICAQRIPYTGTTSDSLGKPSGYRQDRHFYEQRRRRPRAGRTKRGSVGTGE